MGSVNKENWVEEQRRIQKENHEREVNSDGKTSKGNEGRPATGI